MSFELQYSYRTKQAVYRKYFVREVNVNTDGGKCRRNADSNNREPGKR